MNRVQEKKGLVHLRCRCRPRYIWSWCLARFQHTYQHGQPESVTRSVPEAPSAVLERSILPFESPAGIVKTAILELTVDEDVFLYDEGGTRYRVSFVDCDRHGVPPLAPRRACFSCAIANCKFEI